MLSGLIMIGIIVVMVAPGLALKRTRDDSGQASADALITWLGFAGLALIVVALVRVFGWGHAGEACGMALPALRIRTLYPYAHRSDSRDESAPHGWVMTLYRTTPVRTEHGIGITSTPLDQAWFPTRGHATMAAEHIGWKLNGERVPGSSFGWTARAGDLDGAWRYGFSVAGEPMFHGYAIEWRAVGTVADHSPERLHTADLGPIRTYARDVLYGWSGDTRAYVDGLSDEELTRRIDSYIGEPYSLGTLYRDGLDEAMLRAEEDLARASARETDD